MTGFVTTRVYDETYGVIYEVIYEVHVIMRASMEPF
jgi:hypothetical protein